MLQCGVVLRRDCDVCVYVLLFRIQILTVFVVIQFVCHLKVIHRCAFVFYQNCAKNTISFRSARTFASIFHLNRVVASWIARVPPFFIVSNAFVFNEEYV